MIEFMLEATLVGSVALGFIVLLSDSKRLSNRLFAAIAFCLGVWSFSILLFNTTRDPAYALAYAKIFYAGSVVFTPLLVLFAIHYPRAYPLSRRYVLPMAIAAIVGVMTIISYDAAIIQTLTREADGWSVTINKTGYLLFSAYFVAYFVAASAIALYKFSTYRGAERLRASFYAIGMIGTSIPGFIFDLVLPFYGEYRYIWIGPVASVAFLAASGYSIARHRLLNIKAFLAKSALYILVVGVIVSLYAALLYIMTSLLLGSQASTEASFAANVASAMVIAFSYAPIRQYLDRITRRVFYGNQYDSQRLIDQVSTLCVKETDLAALLAGVVQYFDEALGPRYIAVLFNDNAHGNVIYGKASKRMSDRDHIEHLYEQSRQVGAVTKAPHIYCLRTPSQDIGYFVVGPQRDGRPYGSEDEHVMSVATDELSIAIQNIYRLEEIRSFAKTLETEVNDATKELRMSNKKLREMDATKDEFVSMASHQLRTPLTSVKGYISMVLEGDAGEISDTQRQLLSEAYTSSERMVHLIGDFLNVSRLQNGKFMIDRRSVDLSNIVKQEVEGMRQIAEAHAITVRYKQPARFPLLYLDEGKLRQVIMNFIDNAIYYSPEHTSITVSLIIEDGDALLRVKDEGMGVPKAEQHHLFTKFFRAENARKQRPDGTGIGLYLAKKIINGHGGKLVFESEIGKGSTFGFRLPIHRLSSPPPVHLDDQPKTTP